MIYHYTKNFKLPSIMAHGLEPSANMLAKHEKPVNWFTRNPIWENTVFARNAPSFEAAHNLVSKYGWLLARIGCDDAVATYTWEQIKRVASIPKTHSRMFANSALRCGSDIFQWRCGLTMVPVEYFTAIEVYDGKTWIPYRREQIDALVVAWRLTCE